MKISCPYCDYQLDVPALPQHRAVCPECKKKFFAAGDLAFRYGILLDETPVKVNRRVACPYCSQHHKIAFEPQYNMLGCASCLKIFIVDDQESVIENSVTVKLDDSANAETSNTDTVPDIPAIQPPPASKNPAVNPPPHRPPVNNQPPIQPPPAHRAAPNALDDILNKLRSKVYMTENIKTALKDLLLKVTDTDNADKIIDFLDKNLVFVIAGAVAFLFVMLLIMVLIILPAIFKRDIKIEKYQPVHYEEPAPQPEPQTPAKFQPQVLESIRGEDGQEYVVMSTDPGKKNGKLKLNSVKNNTTSFIGEDGTEWIIVE